MRTSDKMIQSPLYDIIADDFAHRYAPTYSGVNSRSGLTTLDPALIARSGWINIKVMAARIYTKLLIS